MSYYVVKRWKVEEEPDEKGLYINIAGRMPGALSWLMSLIGIDPTFSIEVDSENFIFQEGSWSGKRRTIIPLKHISSVFYGYQRPWQITLGLFMVIAVAISYASTLLIAIPTAAVLAIIYFIFMKTLVIGVSESGGGKTSSIQIRRSLIENKGFNEFSCEQICAVLYQLVAGRA